MPQNKMEKRAYIMSVLNKYRTVKSPKDISMVSDIEDLKSFEDSDYLARVLFFEMNSENQIFQNVCAIMALEVIPKDIFEKHALDFLQNKQIDDKKKFFVISLIKQKGIYFDYDSISSFIDDPKEIAQEGVEDFLDNILSDVEVQIDMLDFYTNIPYDEKIYLLDNFSKEEINENIIKAFSVISYLDIKEEETSIILDALSKTSSPYALEALNNILKKPLEDFGIDRKQTEKLYRTINFKNRNFRDLGIVENSQPFESYMSYIDGRGDFSLIFSRIKEDNSILSMFVTLNIKKGITSCMGLSDISKENFNNILSRLFSDLPSIKISPMALKSILKYFYQINQKDVPFEFFAWKNLLNDINTINYDLFEYLTKRIRTTNLDIEKVKDFINSRYMASWFWTKEENSTLNRIVSKIEKEKILNYNLIDKIISDEIRDFMDKDFLEELKKKLSILAFAAQKAGMKMTAVIANSLLYKNPYMKFFISSMFDRSLYQYFLSFLEDNREDTIFKKRAQGCFLRHELEYLIKQIELKWK